MNFLKIILLSITFYNFQAILSEANKSNIQHWFKMKLHSEVNKECESKANYSINSKVYGEYRTILEQYWEPLYYWNTEKFDYVLQNVYNIRMIEKLKEIINLIQGCLDNGNQLDPNELVMVIDHILTIHAKRVLLLNSEMIAEMGACRFIVKADVLKKCEKEFENILYNPSINDITLFQLLTGSIVSSTSCKEILPLEQCFMKAFAPCKPSARKIVKLILSPTDNENIICEEFLKEIELYDNDNVNGIMSRTFKYFKNHQPLFRVQ
ncbi:uncharacterized protein LOC122498529 [Leptopilina heterotoma]|uniref:uncharacterized protein LOC122498529 n=1 Tax=Leptopilina heterotoma TaxID=63436 RepID=UPI001CA9312B|nr:uncharacterized protein LOC122498529 [Leptopilina heterotoma]